MLVDRGAGVPPEHRRVRDLPELIRPGDLLVVNDTRVLPARLRLWKATGGQVEVLLLTRRDEGRWEALVRPSRRVPAGSRLCADGAPVLEVGEPLGDGRRLVALLGDEESVLAHGEVPLPPYVHTPLDDPERYQTVFATRAASVAAPTAGLHLTEAVLDRCRAVGVPVVSVDLEVGLGTFRPITTDRVEDHRMHEEAYRIPAATWTACQEAERVIAVGTTTVRALESAARRNALEATTDLFIHPGHEFAVVDVLLTNFHAPRSSLLVLLETFMGPRWRDAYRVALDHGYRFLSLGDAMLVERHG